MIDESAFASDVQEKIRALSHQFAETYKCSYSCAKRSVTRHHPLEAEAAAEIDAKCNRVCLLVFGGYGTQGKYLKTIGDAFYSTGLRAFPHLEEPSSDTVAFVTAAGERLNWKDVYASLSGDVSAPVAVLCLKGLPPVAGVSGAAYERMYQDFVIKEGVRHAAGFVTMYDGNVPLTDYFASRASGRSAAELAATLSLCACADRNDAAKHGIVLEVPDGDDAHASSSEDEWARQAGGGPPAAPLPPVRNIFGNSVATSLSSRQDKGNVQRLLKGHNLNYVRSVDAYSGPEACAKRENAGIAFPVIVKPVSGAGSEFISLCHCDDEIETAFFIAHNRNTTQGTLAGHMIVEEYIEGPEYVVNAVGFRNDHVVTDIWRSRKFPVTVYGSRLSQHVETRLIESQRRPLSVESTTLLYDDQEFVHSLSDLPVASEPRRVVDYTLQCLTALGMYNGCSHCELRVDDRADSPRRGQPVLIELNPRPQGDIPRATDFVGYDQYTLLFYLAAASAAFPARGSAAAAHETMHDALPWPPAPPLYRSRSKVSLPLTERPTIRILFLNSPCTGVLCTYGVRKIEALPTFRRTTRSNIFEKRDTGFIASVFQTMDLLSSPGALVLEGTSRQLEEDAQFIRTLEKGNVEFNSLLVHLSVAYRISRFNNESDQLSNLKPKVKEFLDTAEFPPLYVDTQQFNLLVRLGLGSVLTCEAKAA
ncbi:hypothetical protein STCU_08219 [Strigomonas culicis]|uniref:ATP-grasp domain-containing protein n=2 Tax=Strigomonas culicis TaxID=28005 RepID=S9TVT4_9TRYP|nr:hypothetical protein STCU_08219 [Strigomonas culicis]|eukprot:EPY22567.1 hypothetical protein STCU_08219 [Strigomonas culicis]